MANTFNLFVTYNQFSVFNSQIPNPFNRWDPRHVAQGFAWRQGAVSFRTMVEDGDHNVEVHVRTSLGPIAPHATRVIEVPFEVDPEEEIELATISDTLPLSVPCGTYLLRAEFLGERDGAQQVRITFVKESDPQFSVPIADSELHPDLPFLTNAEPAV